MTYPRNFTSILSLSVGGLSFALAAAACGDDDCTKTATCPVPSEGIGGMSTTAQATTTGTGGSTTGSTTSTTTGGSSGGGGGGGGAAPEQVDALGLGFDHSCAVTSDGRPFCWGEGANGKLFTEQTATVPTAQLGTLEGVVSIDGGVQHSCAVLDDGSVWCVGSNSAGQLGNGDNEPSTQPVQVVGIANAVSVSLGEETSCALLNDETARCWGLGGGGQLGNGQNANSNVPVSFAGSGVAQVEPGGAHTCIRTAAGEVRCAGNGARLGDGQNINSAVPVDVAGIDDAIDIAVGLFTSCAVRANGKVVCWGYDSSGQCGDGTANQFELTPVEVAQVSGAVEVVIDGASACALLNDGTARCWGANSYGQLGNGATSANPTPTAVQVLGLTTGIAISAGYNHACALRADRSVVCWGRNNFGQLGNGNMSPSTIPTSVMGLP